MKNYKSILIFIFLFLGMSKIFAQNLFEFYGFVRTDAIYDTRKVVQLREGNLILYPENIKKDAQGNDINATPTFNLSTIASRAGVRINGGKALGANITGQIEGEFFGSSDANINTFRLRHSFVRLGWERSEFLMGQYWHPLFTEESYPNTVSFGTGIPFCGFDRSPLVQYSYNVKGFSFRLAAISQRDFSSTGPSGVSYAYQANSGRPEITLGVHYKSMILDSSATLWMGIVAENKSIQPRLHTDSNLITNKTLESSALTAYLRLQTKSLEFKLKGLYGENMYDQLTIGGYAIRHYGDLMPTGGDWDYTSILTASAWADIDYKLNSNWSTGFFAGWAKNLGSANNIQDWNNKASYFSRGYDIDQIYRVSPRIRYSVNFYKSLPTDGLKIEKYKISTLQFGFETEYTAAKYGNLRNSLGLIQEKSDAYPNAEISNVGNYRFLFMVSYNF
ncbi:MAG: DcaP family trimeric outer membrane transporter [Bacteroidales bacterium]|nr:DcaP family trimeric outer membrane transporter [Bacteroidales bacterium]